MRALKIAATGMDAQQTRVEVISNNIANMSTTAYRPRRAEFADLHYEALAAPGSISSVTGTVLPTGVQLGLGVRLSAVHMEIKEGAKTQSNGPLDIAIEGKGWLEVRLPSGESAYTRNGALSKNGEGLIVNSDGYQIGDGVTVPKDALSISINANGEVYANYRDKTDPKLIGTISLNTFVNEKGLEALGAGLFKPTTASGEAESGLAGADGRGFFRQGFLEASSVDVVEEITDLIEAQRGYEMNSKVVTAADEMLGATVQIR